MGDVTTNLTGTAQLDDSAVLAFAQQFLIAAGQDQIMDQFATIKEDIGAKSISFTKYARLALATTPLNEREEATSTAMSDTDITLTPAEHGLVVTRTLLSNLQSGGKVDVAAARLVGLNMGATLDRLAIAALEAAGTANQIAVGHAEASLAASDVLTGATLETAYNKLSRKNVVKLDGGAYVMVAHDDAISDLRSSAAAGSWTDVARYAGATQVLRNEIGMYKGFRIVMDNNCLVTDGGGSGNVDSYRTLFLGYNALGKAVSMVPQLRITGPFDKLARFLNVGWLGCLKYQIIDSDAVWMAIHASSVGENS